jgi:hypothetical protein
VIKSYFHSFKGAKPIGSSGYHSDFVVEALDRSIGDLAFGSKPVQQQLFMRS